MAPRRSHHKSRNGCLMCKQRHVKCDETGPPCTKCVERSTECKYAPVRALRSEEISRSTSTDAAKSLDRVDETSQATRVLELRLMHQWATVTYKCVSTDINEDHEIWRTDVPNVAMSYDFLLFSLFSASAYEIAATQPDEAPRMISVALEYQSKAFKLFRTGLEGLAPTAEAHDALLYCSMILLLLAPAASGQMPEEDSMITNFVVHHELVRGVNLIILKRPEAIKNHKLFLKTPDMYSLPKKPYDVSAARAISLMGTLNDARYSPSMLILPTIPGQEPPLRTAEERAYLARKNALWWLDYLFSTCSGNIDLAGYALCWPSLAGDDFVDDIKRGDDLALLILMWWGVLLEPLGKTYWYFRDFGARIVGEVIGDVVQPSVEAQEIVALAARQMLMGKGHAGGAEAAGDGVTSASYDVEQGPLVSRVWSAGRSYWKGETKDRGNVPADVMNYLQEQNSRLFAGPEERARLHAVLTS